MAAAPTFRQYINTIAPRWAHFASRMCAAALASLCLFPVHAGTLYRCTEANGKVTYSGKPCQQSGNAGVERTIDYPIAPPRVVVPVSKRAAPVALPVARNRPPAAIRLFYDPANAPVEHPLGQMEKLIRGAVALWSEGCAVELEYGGTASYVTPGSPTRVSIRWSDELMYARHPDNDAAGIAGVGSLRDGISLRPRVGDDELPRIVVHEIGHVLGIGHLHEDPRSVMSYIPDKAWA